MFEMETSANIVFVAYYVRPNWHTQRLIKYIAADIPIIANKNSNPCGVGVGVGVQAGEGEGKSIINGVVVGI